MCIVFSRRRLHIALPNAKIPTVNIGKDTISFCLNVLYLTCGRADPDTIHWAQNLLNVPFIDHWWETETGWIFAGNPLGIEPLPVKIRSPHETLSGYDIQILDETENPLPPGTFPTLWNAEEWFLKPYLSTFPRYYETEDAGCIDEDGYLICNCSH